MGILDGISLPGMPVMATPTAVAATIPLVPAHDVLSQIAQVANVFTPAQPTREFAEAVGVINSKGYGFVALAGAAAQMFGVLNQHVGVNATYTVQGWGTLSKASVVDDPAKLIAVARDMSAIPPNPNFERPTPIQAAPVAPPAQLGILAPNAPQSSPALAADPVPGFVHPTAVSPNVQIPGLMASVPPATAAVVIAQTSQPAAADSAIPAERVKRKYTRRAKTDDAPSQHANDATNYPTQGVGTGGGMDGLWLFVNTRPNIDHIDLHGWITKLCDDLARHHKLIVPDLRTATGDHSLSFGKWKGHLAAYARACAGKLEPGAYYLRSTVGNEIAECVLEGLRAAKRLNADGTETTDSVFELIVFSE